MRYLEFGKFTTQHPAFDFTRIVGRSILAWQSTENTDFPASVEHNETLEVMEVMDSTEYSNPQYSRMLIQVQLASLRALLGQIPVIVSADLAIYHQGAGAAGSWGLKLFRMLTTWDLGDVTARYRDLSALLTWYQDVYAPMWGQDVASVPDYDSGSIAVTDGNPAAGWYLFPVRDALSDALADNDDLRLLFQNRGTTWFEAEYGLLQSRYPHLRIWYLFPVEFYASTPDGAIDLATPISDAAGGSLYLGAVERGETGTPTKAWLRNYSPNTINAEVFDDHPEYDAPQQIAGTGTGALDFIDLVSSAVSQRYTVVFYSATQYEVKAEAYRDNVLSLHPQINADASWRGAVSSTFTAPSGGLVIPPAAWRALGILTGDSFEVKVAGNSTNTSWPADAGQQVEVARDDGSGNADSATWRPLAGRRERTRAAVTIDATSKFIPTRRVRPADWPTGTKAFIMDNASINEGQVASVSEAALGAVTFSGTGLDDCTPSGNYAGNASRTYRVEIDATGTPDTFRWSNDSGSTWQASGVAITGAVQELEDGVLVTFGATTGHTLNDFWQFTATPWGITLSGLTANSNAYASGARIGTTLPLRGVAPTVFSTMTAAAGASESPASRIYLEDLSGFASAQAVFVFDPGSGVSESATVDAVGSTYIDLTANLGEDYPAGSFVTVKGVGEAAFHLRPAALVATTEEKKTVRINARV